VGVDLEGAELVQQPLWTDVRVCPSLSGILHGLAAANRPHWIE